MGHVDFCSRYDCSLFYKDLNNIKNTTEDLLLDIKEIGSNINIE